jgi:1-acyl-sn-glycerol-3-phosphate acyltransferase
VIYYLLNRKDIISLVAEKYKRYLWSRILVKFVDGIFVDRFNADIGPLRETFRRIKRGGVIALAPEGTRSPTTTLNLGWDGSSYIAAKAALPILPIGITGTADKEVVQRLKRFKRLVIRVVIGEIFTLAPFDHNAREGQLSAYTEEIMCRIAAELPESYRGIYSNHPRLRELLQQKQGSTAPSPVAANS